MKLTFYDILGIDPTIIDQLSEALKRWPKNIVSLTPGINNGANDSALIVRYLQDALAFTNIHPGVDSNISFENPAKGQISLAADMYITGNGFLTAPTTIFYLRSMPDVGIQLIPTNSNPPAQVFFASDDRGFEVLIDRLPVRIFLKSGLASALDTAPVIVGNFDPAHVDTFAYTLQDETQPSEIDVIVRIHLTPEGDIILEPTVPISFGPVRFMGLPAKNVYDIQLIPSPNRREYLEWTRNNIDSFFSNPPIKGAVGFRSIDFDFSQPPFSDMMDRLSDGAVNISNLELVLENIVIPLLVPGLPIPSHGTFGFRRRITDRNDINQAYNLLAAPVVIPIYGSPQQGGSGGSSLSFTIEKLFISSGDPATFQFQAGLIWETASGNTLGVTFGIDDDWTVFAGFVMDPQTTPVKFKIADTEVSLVGIKFGVSISRLIQKKPFKDSFELVADLALYSPPTGSDNSAFKMRSLTGKPLNLVLHDIGWRLGHVSADGLEMPDGMQLIFADTVRIIVEEMGWVEEPNGTPYFSFSGGVALGFGGGNAVKPSGDPNDDQGTGFGLRVMRLRFRTNGDTSQPLFKIDGIFLNLHFGSVWIEGSGYITDYEVDDWAIKEWGFGVKVQFDALAMKFSIAAEFIKGSRQSISQPTNEFDYFMASLNLGWLPAGPIGLYNIRALVANNMAPDLDQTFPDGEGMALLSWYQNHSNALDLPPSRTLNNWIVERDAFSLGVGCSFSFNGTGDAMKIDAFIFVSKGNADTGFLIVGSLLVLKNPNPIAFVAIEYDIDKEKFGVMVGVDIGLADFAGGSPPSWLANLARLSGSIYFGNQPWALAIGQLADQRTWLSLNIDWTFLITAKLQVGFCLQLVDGGPKGFGFVITLSAGANWGIGSFIIWGTFGLIVGTWKTGSDTSGVEFWVSLGFKITIFWVFTFGAEISAQVEYLGKHPWYTTASFEIRLDTPWFLPDITFKFDKTWQECLPFDTSTMTQCLSSSSALEATSQSEAPLLVPGLSDELQDPSHLYTFNELVNLQGVRIADTHALDTLPIVSTDATIVINFTQPVSNDSMIAMGTYSDAADAGVQEVQGLQIRYGLQSIAIRRSPRFGPSAGTWSDLLKADDTEFSIGGVAPEIVTFAWDVDSRADGKLAPKRLLVNSSSPYSFATAAPQNDEEAMRNDPGYPCCDSEDGRNDYPTEHSLAFEGIGFGTRVPSGAQFTGNGTWWRWMIRPTPVVAPGDPSYPGRHVARFFPHTSVLVGVTDFSDPAATGQITLAWQPLSGRLYLEGYNGLTRVAQQVIDLHNAGRGTYTCTSPLTSKGMTRLILRVEMQYDELSPVKGSPYANTQNLNGIDVLEISYLALADVVRYVADEQRCQNGATMVAPPGSDASGKLAWLPNHDYEIVITGALTMSHKAAGSRSTKLSEAFYFRTKGLLGLNACPNVGDDLRRYVESTYPAIRSIPLYREEPTVLAFTEGLSSVLPIDRAPLASDSPEKAQMFPLILNVDRIESRDGLKRLTVPSDDWITQHQASAYQDGVSLAEPSFARAKTRRASSLDPFVKRHEAVISASPSCGQPPSDYASQVLLHEPIDADGGPTAWEAATGYRATVRQQDGPYIERSSFDAFDLATFIPQADGSASAISWNMEPNANARKIVAPVAAGGRHYLSCGDLTWDHLQVYTLIDLRGAIGGLSVGVGDGTPVPTAIIATVESDDSGYSLILRKHDGSGEVVLDHKSVTVTGPVRLTVIAFDDTVRANVGDVVVEGTRGAVREGRVALVADGAAAFAGIHVDALDIYTYNFITSRYDSFQEHISSFDGQLSVLTSGAFGGSAATMSSVLSTHGMEIAPLMLPAADPQERQNLFASFISTLGLGLRKTVDGLCLSRMTDSTGMFGLLIESPEPISFVRDVTVTLTQHTSKWIPQPIKMKRPSSPIVKATLEHIGAAKKPVKPNILTPISQPQAGTMLNPIVSGHFEDADVTIPLQIISNGSETTALLLAPSGVLNAGRYTLKFVLDRSRWRSTTASDPEQAYHQECSIELQW